MTIEIDDNNQKIISGFLAELWKEIEIQLNFT